MAQTTTLSSDEARHTAPNTWASVGRGRVSALVLASKIAFQAGTPLVA